MNNKETLQYALNALKEAGVEKAQVELIITEKHELNTESGVVKLFRSNENASLKMKAIAHQKQGTLTLNKVSTEAIDEGIESIKQLMEASPEDAAYDIAQKETGDFKLGIDTPNLDDVYDALKQLMDDMKSTYPQILADALLSYDMKKRFILNTNDLDVCESKGSYGFMTMFAAKDEDRITSFNFTDSSMVDLRTKLIEVGLLNELFDQTILELDAKPLNDKFIGDVIVTPHCLVDLLEIYSSIALQDGSLISDKSMLKNKREQQVASEKLSWYSNPESVQVGAALTGDGFVAKDMPIIEKGMLKNFMVSQYGANKTGLERSNSYGGYYVIEAGDMPYEDMIKDIEKGILLCRFSGGRPASDGNFSGVAKNSFLIENGKIVRPITETMISGNLFDLFKDIKGISKERMNSGHHELPWLYSTNTTISG